MKTLVALEQRFARTPDGAVWTDGQFPYPFWLRYLEVFDEVRIVARVKHVNEVPADWLRTDGQGVFVDGTPHYHGMWQYLMKAGQVKRAIRATIQDDAAVILRIGSQLANVLHPALVAAGHPFGVEVVADPYDVFSPGAIQHPLRPFFRWHFTRLQQRQCRGAVGASYVTNEHLQQRYPVSPGAFQVACSSVELPDEAFAASPREFFENRPIRIVTVGAMAQRHKRIDVLIDAVQIALKKGLDVSLRIVGDGQFRAELESQANNYGLLNSKIEFVGQLAGAASVREELRNASLFVMPSKHEGLPRAILEAMAVGLPCIGTRIGGIPELLDDDNLVAAGEPAALADKIIEVVRDPNRMASMSARNLASARDYSAAILHERRTCFYQYLREATERWLARRTQPLRDAG